MGVNDRVAKVMGIGEEGGQLGRRALFGSLRRPVAAAAVLAVGFASSGALRALPAAADDIEYCDVDPIVFVDVHGVRTGVKVLLGWLQSANPLIDRPATMASIQASSDGTTISVSATVVAPRQGALLNVPTHMQVALLRPGKAPSGWMPGTTNTPMTASISA